MDGYTNYASQELITDIFRDLDRNNDGIIKKREFVFAASQQKDLSNLLIEAADKKKEEIERAKNPDFDAEKEAEDKGQIISECPYEIIVCPKIATKK